MVLNVETSRRKAGGVNCDRASPPRVLAGSTAESIAFFSAILCVLCAEKDDMDYWKWL